MIKIVYQEDGSISGAFSEEIALPEGAAFILVDEAVWALHDSYSTVDLVTLELVKSGKAASLRRLQEIDRALSKIDTAGARPSREVALALLAGKTPDKDAEEKLIALEAQAVKLREERATLTVN